MDYFGHCHGVHLERALLDTLRRPTGLGSTRIWGDFPKVAVSARKQRPSHNPGSLVHVHQPKQGTRTTFALQASRGYHYVLCILLKHGSRTCNLDIAQGRMLTPAMDLRCHRIAMRCFSDKSERQGSCCSTNAQTAVAIGARCVRTRRMQSGGARESPHCVQTRMQAHHRISNATGNSILMIRMTSVPET